MGVGGHLEGELPLSKKDSASPRCTALRIQPHTTPRTEQVSLARPEVRALETPRGPCQHPELGTLRLCAFETPHPIPLSAHRGRAKNAHKAREATAQRPPKA